MSADTVDDLHAAEDFARLAVAALRGFTATPPTVGGLKAARSTAGAVIACWENYCRPTCGAEGNPGYDECEEGDCCGCPCGHA